ncbi:hypothetical protein T4E_8585 [Trichinella pseudospiralis]|uniref:Uncharacterized protein n=1 Tax=Trichinella pseudospiralis TaxID=6337 RepID=A0A0V0XM83_TRIPS|nr:hypothetical protein T4E_1691 [Trichinella pseudospiralis]KRX91138.1 hypothetical protein T4E_8585 [Trichinella pseudospiralis]
MDLLEIITKYESIKELDAEDLLNVKEKWCVVLKTNDDLFLAASQLQSEALGFKYIHHNAQAADTAVGVRDNLLCFHLVISSFREGF